MQEQAPKIADLCSATTWKNNGPVDFYYAAAATACPACSTSPPRTHRRTPTTPQPRLLPVLKYAELQARRPRLAGAGDDIREKLRSRPRRDCPLRPGRRRTLLYRPASSSPRATPRRSPSGVAAFEEAAALLRADPRYPLVRLRGRSAITSRRNASSNSGCSAGWVERPRDRHRALGRCPGRMKASAGALKARIRKLHCACVDPRGRPGPRVPTKLDSDHQHLAGEEIPLGAGMRRRPTVTVVNSCVIVRCRSRSTNVKPVDLDRLHPARAPSSRRAAWLVEDDEQRVLDAPQLAGLGDLRLHLGDAHRMHRTTGRRPGRRAISRVGADA